MGILLLLRHARSTANRQHILAGRTPGVALDESGREQAEAVVGRLDGYPLAAIVTSPLDRCRQTVAPLAAARGLTVATDERLIEVDYGAWTGRALGDLREEPAWKTVQQQPSTMVFPDGEAMTAVSARAAAAARDHAEAAGEHGAVLVCSHGDVIAMILADVLGMDLDKFQRIVVAPASLSVVHYGDTSQQVICTNLHGAPPVPDREHPGPVVGGVTGDRPEDQHDRPPVA